MTLKSDKPTTTLLEDLEDLVGQLQSDKITEKQNPLSEKIDEQSKDENVQLLFLLQENPDTEEGTPLRDLSFSIKDLENIIKADQKTGAADYSKKHYNRLINHIPIFLKSGYCKCTARKRLVEQYCAAGSKK